MLGTLTFPIIITACSTFDVKEITISVSQNFTDESPLNVFSKDLMDEVNKLKKEYSKYANILLEKIAINSVSDGAVIVQNVNTNKSQLGFASAYNVFQSSIKNFDIKIQTKTRAFKGDTEINFYNDQNNPLEQVAKNLQTEFATPPYKDWKGTNKDPGVKNWNNFIYQSIYAGADILVPFYRGMIMIYGKDDKIKEIEKAWFDKDWTKFKSFGIAAGKPTSAGKYILQEKLLKKHFGKNAFTTLAEEKNNNPNFKFLTDQEGKNIGNKNLADYHIVFDDEASYAWNQNKASNPPYYTPEDTNAKVKIFMVTDPLPYDFGFFNKSVPSLTQYVISEALINLANQKRDKFGPSYGYNGYELITNFNEQVGKLIKTTLE